MPGKFLFLSLVSAFLVALMTRLGTLDHPGDRSSHTRPTPKGGGVGIVAAFTLGVLLFLPHDRLALGLVAASLLLAAVSYFDDVHDWPFAVKLAAQVGAAVIATGAGVRFPAFAPSGFGLAPDLVSGALTLAWLVFATNAVNFIDGLNGLASGSVALACAILAGLAYVHGDGVVGMAALAVVAGIAGFLPFNFPHARIFMGDVGSQFCGFISAALGVAVTQRAAAGVSWTLMPLLLFGIYADVVFTLLRRAWAGETITQAHRGHLYQIAQRSGVPAPAVAGIYWIFVILGGLATGAGFSALGWQKTVIAFAVLPAWAAWLAYVLRRAKRADLRRW